MPGYRRREYRGEFLWRQKRIGRKFLRRQKIEFYKKALGLTVTKKVESEDGSFKLAFLGDGTTPHLLELTWLRDMDRPYNLWDLPCALYV